MEPTPQQVKGFWDHMSAWYGSKVKSKASATEMQLIAQALGIMGIVDEDSFMNDFTTTIGKTIYAPFEVGVPSDGHTLWSQIEIGAHEHQHVIQVRDIGVKFAVRYLTDPTWRSVYEGEAYRVSMSLHFWRYGEVPSVEGYVHSMKSYGVSEENLDFFRSFLTMSTHTIEQGGLVDEATKTAVAWLNDNAPSLKA